MIELKVTVDAPELSVAIDHYGRHGGSAGRQAVTALQWGCVR